MEKRRRISIIRELVATRPPSSQVELVQALAARGIDVDQSTISRDLREMGLVRLPGPEGTPVYGFPGEQPPAASQGELAKGVRDFATGFEASANLVVLRTAPGNAHALAAILDRARLDEVAGTVAGDDTIMIVVRERHSAKRLAQRLNGMMSS